MPNTVNVGLSAPNTGDLSGSWGTASTNANWQVVDGILGGNQSISLTGSSATTLSISTGVIGTGSLTPGSGPTQSGNAFIEFTGTLSSNVSVTMPRPGRWAVRNSCTGSFTITARAIGTGNVIGLPPGDDIDIFCDGTNIRFIGLGRVGSYLDLCISTTPAWMSACTVLPYLPCLGTATYSVNTYPALAAQLGSTFGGNGITTFGVPDLGNRYRIPIDTSGSGRITSAVCGINGAVLGASGGSQVISEHTHTGGSLTVTAMASTLPLGWGTAGSGLGTVTAGQLVVGSGIPENEEFLESLRASANTMQGAPQSVTGTSGGTSGASSGNIPPGLVAGIVFIKT